MARTTDITVKVPQKVAARVARFVEDAEGVTLETFISQRIAEMAVGLQQEEPSQKASEQVSMEVVGGYL